MESLDKIIDGVSYLPPLPHNLPRLMELLNAPEVDSQQVVDLIAYDPTLTTNVMKLCNSALFRGASPANDLEEAVLRLGFNEVYQLVVALSFARTLTPPQKGYGLDTGELWQHSVATALAAKLMAQDQGEDANAVFTAGILHDIGKVVLAHALEDTYTQLIREIEQNQLSMLETEKKLLGVQHAEIGGRLLARWKFSAPTVAAVWFHHEPALAAAHQKITSFVYLGNMIAYFMGHGYGHLAFALRGRSEALDFLGMTPNDLPQVMLRTFESLEALKPLLNFSAQ
jgi:putative nucleotidyltransferase with HDIG domain